MTDTARSKAYLLSPLFADLPVIQNRITPQMVRDLIMTFFDTQDDVKVNGLTIGKGAGSSTSTNTAVGVQVLQGNTTGVANTGVGFQALANNVDAPGNTAVGFGAIGSFCTGNGANTAIGYQTLPATTGTQNVACGYWALQANTTGDNNTACGYISMQSNVSGTYNSALGYASLNASTGSFNTGVGGFAGCVNTGTLNVFVGYFSGHGNTSGNRLTTVGVSALLNNVSGSGCVALGYSAGAYETGSNAFYVDNQDRVNTAGDKAKALLYGTFNAAPGSQTLAINAGTVTMLGTLGGVTVLTTASGGAVATAVFGSTGAGATGTVSIGDAGAFGANLKFIGDGGTTPNKYIRAKGGNLEFVNSAYGAVIATLSDAGGFNPVAGFGCNGAAPQTAAASGGSLAAYGAGANGFDTAGHASALYAMVVAIRGALVANGIMS